jgi:hypothetical protein
MQEKHYKHYQGQQTDFSTLFVPQSSNFVEVEGFQICELPFPSGAYYVRNFVDYSKIIEIGFFALNYYCKPPYRTNLDNRNELYENKEEKTEEPF